MTDGTDRMCAFPGDSSNFGDCFPEVNVINQEQNDNRSIIMLGQHVDIARVGDCFSEVRSIIQAQITNSQSEYPKCWYCKRGTTVAQQWRLFFGSKLDQSSKTLQPVNQKIQALCWNRMCGTTVALLRRRCFGR